MFIRNKCFRIIVNMAILEQIPQRIAKKIKRNLRERSQRSFLKNPSHSIKHLEFYSCGEERTQPSLLGCERGISESHCPALKGLINLRQEAREKREEGYLSRINTYLDSRGVNSAGLIECSFATPVNLKREVKIDNDLYVLENELEDEPTPPDEELLHKMGMQN